MTATLPDLDPVAEAMKPAVDTPLTRLVDRAGRLGLAVHASAEWPEPGDDGHPPALAGFIASDFSPLIAAVAARCLLRAGRAEQDRATATPTPTAIVLMSPLGDIASARHVAHAVQAGDRVGPLLFFQAVPNAVAGHVAARFGLAGPVVCVGDDHSGLDVAALLIDDGDADGALVVLAEAEPDRAVALLVGPHPTRTFDPDAGGDR